jgi:arsenate reductase (thioredoxin)
MNDSLGYATLRGFVKDPLALRMAMVRHALEQGVKPTVRKYGTSPQTVRFWLKRYKQQGLVGLKELPRVSKSPHPQTTPQEVEDKIIAFRKTHPHYGQDAIAQHLQAENIYISGKTVGKLLHKHGLLVSKPRAKPTSPPQRLAHVQPFEEVQIDIADLTENQVYARAVARGLLPRHEFSIRDLAGEVFEVHSAGLDPSVVNPFTIQVMTEKGIDMSAHHAKSVREYLGKEEFSYVITVCSRAEDRCPTSFLGELNRLHWPFDDPAAEQGSDEQKLAKFRTVRDEIEAKIKHWLSLPENERWKFTDKKAVASS